VEGLLINLQSAKSGRFDLSMTDHTAVSIPAPKDWQDLERNAHLLFQYSLNDPAAQNNGTSGQRQHGVDIFGRRGGGTGPLLGIQCKGKNADYCGKVTEKELRDEVENRFPGMTASGGAKRTFMRKHRIHARNGEGMSGELSGLRLATFGHMNSQVARDCNGEFFSMTSLPGRSAFHLCPFCDL
jgi:hypothetical protein